MKIDIKSLYDGHLLTTYRGVPAGKCPFDYVCYQMILASVCPDLVIEIGTNRGGSALYLADLLNAIGNGIVHSIDLLPHADAVVRAHPRIKLFTDGFEAYDVGQLERYERILVIDDGAHTYKDTICGLRRFSRFVSVGSYYIVEDGVITTLGLDKQYQGGPLRAIEEFLQESESFEVDSYWTGLYGKNATFNLKGYLRRTK